MVHLPLLLINHQTEGTVLSDATRHKQRLACASAVKFLASLGIKNFPVCGLATYDSYGVLSQAWFSESSEVCSSRQTYDFLLTCI